MLAALSTERKSFVRGLTLSTAVALCVGNMVGTSVYTLPATLARTAGPLSLVAWLATALGYFFVAIVYGVLGTKYPRTGGPYVYAREAFGDFIGFQTVWAYWLSTIIGNAAIATSVIGYTSALVPALESRPWLQFLVAQALVWGLCAINIRGVRGSGRFQIAIVVLNAVPLIVLSLIAIAHFDVANLTPFAPRGIGSLPAAMALVVWAFAGVESATVPAEEIAGEPRTIERSTIIGYFIAAGLFFLSALAAAGAVPSAELAASPRPMAHVALVTAGPWAEKIAATLAVVAGTGTLNGWILMAGRIPVTAAKEKLFFGRLAEIHPRWGTPHTALVAGTSVTSALLLLYFQRSLIEVFELIVLLSVLTTLLPHVYASAAAVALARRDPDRFTPAERKRIHVVAPLAFLFVLYAIYGAGAEVALFGLLAILGGIPLYIVFTTRRDPLTVAPS